MGKDEIVTIIKKEIMDTYLYQLGDKLYLNLTNRCTNACEFCIRNGREGMGDQKLWLQKEPTAEQVKQQLEQTDLTPFSEVVFCGFGEPLMRLDCVVELGRYLKKRGAVVRVNTNGQANLVYGRDVTADLVGAVDVLSISMNAADARAYQRICHSEFGEAAYDAVLNFAISAKARGFRTVLSVVDTLPADQIESCRTWCREHGIPLRVRRYE